MAGKSVLVVGAGIIGATAALELARRGARVTVLDANQASATRASFGWINASYFIDADHYRYRAAGLDAWRRLAEEMSLPFSWQGAISWELQGAALEAQHKELTELGYPVEHVDRARFRALEPRVSAPPDAALLFPDEGLTDPVILLARVKVAAMALGAQWITGLRATALIEAGGTITGVETGQGVISADAVLLAVGTATLELLSPLGHVVPLAHRPALTITTRPLERLTNRVLSSQVGDVRQLASGALTMPAAVAHQGDDSAALGDPMADATAALSRLEALFEVPVSLAEVSLAARPVPVDDAPVVGAIAPGLSVAVMHSGLTLAAITAKLLATEMLDGPSNETQALLAPYRSDRFAGR